MAGGSELVRRGVVAWVLYDLANTIFSMNIVSLSFPLWIVLDMGGRDSHYALANGLSMAAMLFSAPLLGALSDQAPRRMPFLVVSTLVSCACTALLGIGGLHLALGLFVVANFAFLAGLIFYDALLPVVSTPQTRGRVSGLGIGVGYLGSFIGVGLGLLLLSRDPGAKPLLFALTALLFLAFAIPCFLCVPEPARRNVPPFGRQAVGRALADLHTTATRLRRYPDLGRFLLGRLFYTDSANTLIAFMGIYASRELGFGETAAQLLLLVGIGGGICGGLAWGQVVDRSGPKHTL